MTELVKYDAACRALAEAKRVDEAKVIKDQAEAIRAYARQIKNPQLEADAWEIRKRAEDKLGELSAVLPKALHGPGRGNKSLPANGKPFKAEALKDAGISTSAASRYEKFHALPKTEKEKRIARGRAAIESGKSAADAIIRQDEKGERRSQRERELAAKIIALPDKRYGVIVADPEWQWEPWSHKTGMDRAAANHYPTSVLAVIKDRDVPSIAAKDCVLFLWATIPMLPHALTVMAAWGFDYKSHYAWGKDKFGTGYWNREKHELLLIGTRGDVPCPTPGTQSESLIQAPKGEHSAKPECFLKMIEGYYPTIPKIELNRRGPPRPGWDCWGFEAVELEAAE
jgi:N6-adenosine-specific RNA methylase IME4